MSNFPIPQLPNWLLAVLAALLALGIVAAASVLAYAVFWLATHFRFL